MQSVVISRISGINITSTACLRSVNGCCAFIGHKRRIEEPSGVFNRNCVRWRKFIHLQEQICKRDCRESKHLRLPSCCRCSHRRVVECWPRWLRRRLPGSEWGSSCSPPSFGTRNYVLSRIGAADLSSLSLLVVAAKSPRPSSHPPVRTRRARWTNFGRFSDTACWSRLSASL